MIGFSTPSSNWWERTAPRPYGDASVQARTQGGVQVGSPEPPFKINDIHSMHVVEVFVYTHLLAPIHINYETEIDMFVKCFYRSIQKGWKT